MKKPFAVLLAAAVTASLSVSAFAATELTTNPSKNNGAGDYTIGVTGTYVAGTAAEKKVSVDISWESMNFTYTAGGSTYEPSTHKTTITDGGWNTDKPGITVTNHSNVAINAAMSFTAGMDVTATGTFYTRIENPAAASEEDEEYVYTALAAADQKLYLESAEGKVRDDGQADDKSPKGTLWFGISGDAITENKSLGSITVKLAKTDYIYNAETQTYTVYTESGLNTAISNNGNIKLAVDIAMADKLSISEKSVTLDLNGHILSCTANYSGMPVPTLYLHDTSLTLKDTVGGGKLLQSGCGDGIYMFKGSITIENATVETADGGGLSTCGGASAKLNGGTIKANGQLKDGIVFTDTDSRNQLEITGGTVISTNAAIVIRNGTATISNGNFTGTLSSDGGTFTVTGGTFSVNPSAYVGESYTVTDNGNGTWTVTQDNA